MATCGVIELQDPRHSCQLSSDHENSKMKIHNSNPSKSRTLDQFECMIAQLMNYKMGEYLSYGRQATLMNQVCKVVKWLSGPYHLGEDLLGPQGYICLK